MTRWPSGLRRNVKAVVFISVGSNPTRVNVFLLFASMDILFGECYPFVACDACACRLLASLYIPVRYLGNKTAVVFSSSLAVASPH
jgi:hypothetical protein